MNETQPEQYQISMSRFEQFKVGTFLRKNGQRTEFRDPSGKVFSLVSSRLSPQDDRYLLYTGGSIIEMGESNGN